MADLSFKESVQCFELLPGKTLDLQISAPVTVRLKLTLVGFELGKYILLKYPPVMRPSEYKDVLTEGNGVIVRYLLEGDKGQCFAFRSTILHLTKYPEKLIFIDYPKHIENRELRQQQRTLTHLPASIMIEESGDKKGSMINGVIGDISPTGCGFSFKAENEKVKVNKRDIFMCIYTPKGEHKIPARVCNSRNVNGVVSVGVAFKENEQVSELLEHLLIR